MPLAIEGAQQRQRQQQQQQALNRYSFYRSSNFSMSKSRKETGPGLQAVLFHDKDDLAQWQTRPRRPILIEPIRGGGVRRLSRRRPDDDDDSFWPDWRRVQLASNWRARFSASLLALWHRPSAPNFSRHKSISAKG